VSDINLVQAKERWLFDVEPQTDKGRAWAHAELGGAEFLNEKTAFATTRLDDCVIAMRQAGLTVTVILSKDILLSNEVTGLATVEVAKE